MLELRSIYQLEPYYFPTSKKYIFREDVMFHFNLDMQDIDIIGTGNIYAKHIIAKSIRTYNLYGKDLIVRKIIADKIKCGTIHSDLSIQANESTCKSIRAYKIDSKVLIVGDIIAEYIKSRKLRYDTVCIGIKQIHCPDVKSDRNNHIYTCLDYQNLW